MYAFRPFTLVLVCMLSLPAATKAAEAGSAGEPALPPILFVDRQINPTGTVYWNVPRDMPGVGTYSRVRPAAPGRLRIRHPDGSLETLIDGAQPTAASGHLVDVNSPSVSWDGTSIVFAGLPQGSHPAQPGVSVGAWRLYRIQADGSGLSQLTFTDIDADYSQFNGNPAPWNYDDFDPVWLPDGRIVFASTRWPSFAQYSGVRTSNLWVLDPDTGAMHRITSERNGADRPAVDPLTGRIVFSRWWRNFRPAVHDMSTILHDGFPGPGYQQHEGLTMHNSTQVGGPNNLVRNTWQLASIGTDGSGLVMFTGRLRRDVDNHIYGGAFAADGSYYANFFPMANMTEAAGFGGIRHYPRGPAPWSAVDGITTMTLDYVNPNPPSFGVFHGHYAGEPLPLPDGRLVYSRAPDHLQDYDLWLRSADGQSSQPLLVIPERSLLRAQLLAPRPPPPVLPDIYRDDPEHAPHPHFLPPPAGMTPGRDGHFVFDALNVYFNAPVDVDIVSAPPVGSAASIRFYADHQRTGSGSFPTQDWPIVLDERPISPAGRIVQPHAPAFLPVFEQLRGSPAAGYRVPETGFPGRDGAAHVAGMNYSRAGSVERCVGCHAGHTQIALPANPDAAAWTNLAPGAEVAVSSSRDPERDYGLVDRMVMNGPIWRYWTSASGQQQGQWVELAFPVAIAVRDVVLYNPRFGDQANSSIQVHQARISLYAQPGDATPVVVATVHDLTVAGTAASFDEPAVRRIRVDLESVTGSFYGAASAGLAEIEVIGKGLEIVGGSWDLIFQDGFQ